MPSGLTRSGVSQFHARLALQLFVRGDITGALEIVSIEERAEGKTRPIFLLRSITCLITVSYSDYNSLKTFHYNFL